MDINKRNNILCTAEKLFYTIGMNATTMDKLAKESGITKKTIYNYFDSKEDIYYEVMLKSYYELNRFLKTNLEKNNNVTGIDKIKIIGSSLIEFNKTNPNAFKAIFDFQNKDLDNILKNDTAVKCYEEGQYIVETIIKIIKEGIEKGILDDKIDINKTFAMLWAFIVGMTNLINYKSEYIERYLGLCIEDILNYSYDTIFLTLKKKNQIFYNNSGLY